PSPPVELRCVERRHLYHRKVDVDAIVQQLRAQAVGEAADRELGAAVGSLERYRAISEGRADLDYGPAVAWPHALQHGHRTIDIPEVSHFCRAPILLGREVSKQRVAMSTTVGDFLLRRLSEWGIKRIFGY